MVVLIGSAEIISKALFLSVNKNWGMEYKSFDKKI